MSDKPLTIKSLNFTKSFSQLTAEEKLYTYYFYKASWSGFPIVLFNFTKDGPLLFVMFQKFFKSFKSTNEAYEKISSLTSEEEARLFFEYAANIYDNAGNYRSFGFDKIYIKLSKEKFEFILKIVNDKNVNEIYEKIKESIFDTSDKTKSIGLVDEGGVNNYYIGDFKKEEILKIDKFLQENNIFLQNTRLIKFCRQNSNEITYAYLVGSVDKKIIDHGNGIFGFYGDFSEFLHDLNVNLEKCLEYTKRPFQISTIQNYILSFKTGSIEAHRQSQIEWVKDIKPVVETNIGWVETYIDPLNVRGYYEGMVALVDKENTKKFTTLVEKASELLSPDNIPWPKEIESYPFKEPDYTQIDVVCFASDGCPLGINIPNYDDIRENYGFKNVTIGNNIPIASKTNLDFMNEDEKDDFIKNTTQAIVIHTACHELLGHGSGKLLRQLDDGSFNFEYGKFISPLTNQPIDTYYKLNETYDIKFGEICRSYEECRADMNGLFFGKMIKVGKIFGVESEEELKKIVHTKWNLHIRRGILGLKFYNDKSNKWGQAHTQGAYVFASYILKNQNKEKPILKIEFNNDETNFVIIVNKNELVENGHKLVSDMLIKLNVWKASGNINAAKDFYNEHSYVDETMLKIRKIVIEKMPERALTINHNLIYENGDVHVREYEESCKGLIQSYLDRFDIDFDEKILRQEELWKEIEKQIV